MKASRWLRLWMAVSLGGAALSAGAAWAGTARFPGTLRLDLGELAPVEIKGAGIGVTSLNGMMGGSSITTLTLPAGFVDGSPSATGATASALVQAIQVTATLEAGTLGGTAPNMTLTRNTLGFSGGLARLCLLDVNCTTAVPIALTRSGSVGVGVGGQQTAGGTGALRISLDHAPWTLGSVTAIDQVGPGLGTVTENADGCGAGTCDYVIVTGQGFVHGRLSSTGSTVVQRYGEIQYVSPTQITTNIAAGSARQIAGIHEFTIYLPEPSQIATLGSGIVALLVFGWRRLR